MFWRLSRGLGFGDVRLAATIGAVTGLESLDLVAGSVLLGTLLGAGTFALLQVAQDRGADLLVVGALKDRSIAGRLLGTVAGDVVNRAACDVLVIRPADGATELEVPESAPLA